MTKAVHRVRLPVFLRLLGDLVRLLPQLPFRAENKKEADQGFVFRMEDQGKDMCFW